MKKIIQLILVLFLIFIAAIFYIVYFGKPEKTKTPILKNQNQSNLENFNWRKPGVGMFNYALTTNNYDVSRSIMIGDKISDLIPASCCGLSKLIYIPSDLHQNQLNNITAWNSEGNQPIKIIQDLDPKKVFNYL